MISVLQTLDSEKLPLFYLFDFDSTKLTSNQVSKPVEIH